MFYFLSKTIAYLLSPAGWLLAALLTACLTKNTRWRRYGISVALGILLLTANPFLANELARWWEVAPQRLPTDTTVRVAVVLTGGIVETDLPVSAQRPLLGPQADRAGQALVLYEKGIVTKILISGGPGDLLFQKQASADEGQQTARFLQLAGVRAGDIVREDKSRNTNENARFSANVLRQRFHTNRCILVTSAFHMRRAEACFRRQGLVPTVFPGGFMQRRRSWRLNDWLPNEQTFQETGWLIREMIGYLTYWGAGYI